MHDQSYQSSNRVIEKSSQHAEDLVADTGSALSPILLFILPPFQLEGQITVILLTEGFQRRTNSLGNRFLILPKSEEFISHASSQSASNRIRVQITHVASAFLSACLVTSFSKEKLQMTKRQNCLWNYFALRVDDLLHFFIDSVMFVGKGCVYLTLDTMTGRMGKYSSPTPISRFCNMN